MQVFEMLLRNESLTVIQTVLGTFLFELQIFTGYVLHIHFHVTL